MRPDLIYWRPPSKHSTYGGTPNPNYIIEIKNNWSLTAGNTSLARNQIVYYQSLFCENRLSRGVGQGAIPIGHSVGNTGQKTLVDTDDYILSIMLHDHSGGVIGYSLHVTFKNKDYARENNFRDGQHEDYGEIRRLVMPRVLDY